MKGMRNSGYASGRSNGVLVKQQGSIGPSLDSDIVAPDAQQFQVTPHKSGEDWYLSVTPGWVQRVCGNPGAISSTGNRNVTRSASVSSNILYDLPMTGYVSFAGFGLQVQTEVAKVNCYKALRYASVANDLNLGQQYICDEEETMVVLYAPQPGSEVRLAVIGKNAYDSTFGYSSMLYNGGATAVVKVQSSIELTVTKDGAGKVTDVGYNHKVASFWERIVLMKRPLAKFNKTTGELTVYNIGPQSFDTPSETYGHEVVDALTMPDLVDSDWAAAYYQTGDSNGPSGYTFDY